MPWVSTGSSHVLPEATIAQYTIKAEQDATVKRVIDSIVLLQNDRGINEERHSTKYGIHDSLWRVTQLIYHQNSENRRRKETSNSSSHAEKHQQLSIIVVQLWQLGDHPRSKPTTHCALSATLII
jgi:hypothetical protein